MYRDGDARDVLALPGSRDLLASAIPARLAYAGRDGSPRVLPIWFHWTGEALVLCSRAGSAKVRAIERAPRVALTVDSEAPPYRSLQIRGDAAVEVVDGIPPEYALAAVRYYGDALARRWLDHVRPGWKRGARIVVTPRRARLMDLGAALPQLFR